MPHSFPEAGFFLRLHQILGNPKSNPPTPPLIPVSKSTWWAGVKTGRFPKPVKLSERTTAWRVADLEALLDRLAKGDGKGKNEVYSEHAPSKPVHVVEVQHRRSIHADKK